MSERAPSASTTTETAPSSPEATVDAEIDASAQSLENAVNAGGTVEGDASSLENALNPDAKPKERPPMEQKDPLELTSEEETAKVWFERTNKLRTAIREGVTPRLDSLEAKMNGARNKRDKAVKKAFMLEFREGSRQRKSARLEARLEKATPGSWRHRRLSYKYGKANRKLGEMQARIGRLDAAPDARARDQERKQALREKEIQLRRDILKAEKKVSHEKKLRRRMTKEMNETTNEVRRDMLKREMAEWKNIGAFRRGLLDEAMKKYKKLPERDDYELAA